MQFFEAQDGARLAFRDEGHGVPLLALAGFSRDSRDFDYLARHLPHDVRLIRLDCRGRGQSVWTGPQTYTLAQEMADAVALIDHLEIERVAVIGTSRGGLIGMLMAHLHWHRLLGLCLIDVGPVLERAGLLRIGTYLGCPPTLQTLEEVADRLPSVSPGFSGVSVMRWAEEAVRHFEQLDDHVGLTYDPSLREVFHAAMVDPLPEVWHLFEACAGLPVALVRGVNSDVLSAATVQLMRQLRPDMLVAEVPGRGHVPFLDEPEALACIRAWLQQIGVFDGSVACHSAVDQVLG